MKTLEMLLSEIGIEAVVIYDNEGNEVINIFSPYQAKKAGIFTIGYYPVDVEIQRSRRDLILLNFDKFTPEQKSIACKMLITIERNINFFCSMINQQNLERMA